MLRKLSQIKSLAALEPDKEWINRAKYQLLADLAAQSRLSSVRQLSRGEKLDLFISSILKSLVPSASRLIAGFLIIAMSSTVGLAAQASVPGQMLWPVKRSIEKAELTLTFSQIKETEVHLKHVNNRLGEIDKILKDVTLESVDSVSKEKAIKQTVRHLEKDVAGVDSSLKIVREESRPSQVVELVKKVTAVTKEVKSNIKEKQATVSDKVIGEVLKNAEAASEKTKDSAVSLVVALHDEVVAVSNMNPEQLATAVATGTIDLSVESVDQTEVEAVKEGVKAIMEEEINSAISEIADTKAKVDVVNEADFAKIKDGASIQEVQEVDDVKQIAEAATVKIDEAKALLEGGAMKDALEKVTESKEVNEKAEVVLDKLEAINDQEKAESETNAVPIKPSATSTRPSSLNQDVKIEAVATQENNPYPDVMPSKEEEIE